MKMIQFSIICFVFTILTSGFVYANPVITQKTIDQASDTLQAIEIIDECVTHDQRQCLTKAGTVIVGGKLTKIAKDRIIKVAGNHYASTGAPAGCWFFAG